MADTGNGFFAVELVCYASGFHCHEAHEVFGHEMSLGQLQGRINHCRLYHGRGPPLPVGPPIKPRCFWRSV